jgi:hypothetical protein
VEVTLKEYIESRMDEREKAHVAQIINAERSLELAATALREKLENWQANVTGRQIVFGGAVIIGSGTIAGVVIAVARMLGH